MNESQTEALANFKFRFRGVKRTATSTSDDQGNGPNAKVSKSAEETIFMESRGMPDSSVDVRLIDTSSGNSTIRLAVPRDKIFRLENAGLISVQNVSKTPDGKKLSVGNTDCDQVIASSAKPFATVEGYLAGFPVPSNDSVAPSQSAEETATPATKEKPKRRKICAVPTCTDPQDKHYFMFPFKDRTMNHKWVQKVKRADKEFNPNTARICEDHFSAKMIQRDLKAELLGLQVKKKLVKGAFPDVNLPGQKENTRSSGPDQPLPEVPQDILLRKETQVTSPTMNETANCTVKGCRNPNKVRYYSFPKDEETRKIWIKRCGRKENFNTKKRSVCAIHFTDADFKLDLKAQLLEGIERKILKEDAIPSLHLKHLESVPQEHGVSHEEDTSVDISELLNVSADVVEPVQMSEREKRQLAKSRKTLVSETLKQDGISAQKSLEDQMQKLKEENDRLKKEHEEKDQIISDLEVKVKSLEMDRKKDKKANLKLQKKVKRLQSVKPKEVKKELKKTLEARMSPANVKMIMNPQKRWPHYSDQDKIEALVLSTISKKCYKQIRSFNQLQLPSLSTLQKWLSQFECSPGFQEDAIRVLKTMKEKTELKNYNICELTFDEVDVKKNLMEIDMKAQKVYGPCNKVQMVVIRGLYQAWKQPIYYNFNESMKKPLLFKIIERMSSEGFDIRAITCDLGNTQILSTLGFYKGKFSFQHPSDPNKKIYIFPDVPHVLKLARNHMFDKGFLVPTEDNKQLVHLGVEDFWNILEKDEGNYKATKLTEAHLLAKQSARQRVRLAAQVFSTRVAKVMVFNDDSVEAKARSTAIQLFNDWFDVFNSGSKIDDNPLKCGLGFNEAQQFSVLDRMEKFIDIMEVNYGEKNQNPRDEEANPGEEEPLDEIDRLIRRKEMERLGIIESDLQLPPPEPKSRVNVVIEEPRKKPALLPWQVGIKCAINAIRGLYQDLVVNGNFRFILTKRLTQDCVENIFSQFRSLCGDNDHPGPVSTMRRFRILLIGKHCNIMVSENAAVEKEKEDPKVVEEEQEIVSKSVTRDIPVVHIHEIEVDDTVPEEDLSEVYTEQEEVLVYESEIDSDHYHKWNLGSQVEAYVAGYFAKKFPKLNLGKNISEFPTIDDDRLEKFPWLKLISKGGLMVPTDDWLDDFRRFEAEFIAFHGDEIDKGEKLFDRFRDILKEKFGDKYPTELYALFSKFRTCNRVKSLNKKIVQEQQVHVVRHHKQLGQFAG